MNNQTILITGGAGYIGSHACVELLTLGYNLVVIDNLVNSNIKVFDRIKKITGKNISFYQEDVSNFNKLCEIFSKHKIDAVIHFAGLKAVGESVANPILYYQNNLSATINLCKAMLKFNVNKLVFSSSATVYGDPNEIPIKENHILQPTNPYGQTKMLCENFLKDLHRANNNFLVALLRYFNPVGAHPSGLIGENPFGLPNNLMPYISQVAVGRLNKLSIFGNDYDTHDGTGVRDYIHVLDLIHGHILALEYLNSNTSNILTVNLGTGQGYSVLDIVNAFEKASSLKIPYEFIDRRDGDIAKCYACPNLAREILGFKAKFTLEQMCEDSWRWQQNNPNGY